MIDCREIVEEIVLCKLSPLYHSCSEIWDDENYYGFIFL